MKRTNKHIHTVLRFSIIKRFKSPALLLNNKALPFNTIILLCFLTTLFSASCSTTRNLPEGEKLYTGIKSIEYTDKSRNTGNENDSTGVIKAIAETAQAVDELFSSHGVENTTAQNNISDSSTVMTEKELHAIEKARKAADQKSLNMVKEEIDGVLAYAPNNALFGSSSHRQPLAFGLWFYNGFVNSKNSIGKWIFKKFAKQPVLISTVNPELRAKVATSTLQNFGYFRGSVDYELISDPKKPKQKIRYYVNPRAPYRLDSIAYLNFPASADSLIRRDWEKRLLKKGDVFNLTNISNEQTRLRDLFRNNGYYFYNTEYTTFRADTFVRPGHVQLQVLPAKDIPDRVKRKWYYGKKYIYIDTYPDNPETKSFKVRDFEYNYTGKKIPLRPSVWRHNIFSWRGFPYSYNEQKFTLEKLSNMGLFSQLNMSYVPRDSTDTCDTLDVYIYAQMDKPYESEFTMDINSKSNDQIGPGAAFKVTKKDAFRAGESMSFRIYGSYEWQMQTSNKERNDLLNSYELGTSLELKFPRIFFPGLKNRQFFYPTSTTFSLSSDWINRASYFNMVKFALSMSYSWQRSRTTKHELTVFSLDFDRMIRKTAKFDSIMTANPALYISMRDQFIPWIGYTYTYSSPKRTTNPIWFQGTIKESGNLLSGIYAIAGKGFSDRNKKLLNNPFAQFVKATAEFRKTFSLGPSVKLATRVLGGIIYTYGNSNVAPYSEQFNIGGANNVRAFTVRSIGPGRFKSPGTKYSYMDQTGDIKFAANAELRFPLFGSLFGATFLDAGNVWLLRKDESRPKGQINASEFLNSLALGTGVGLRYDMEFLVLRLDLGVGIHAPYDTGKSGYYNMGKFTDSLALHFAIGYPF